MLQIKKKTLTVIALFSLCITFGLGYLVGNNFKGQENKELPTGINLSAQAIIKEISISEVIQEENTLHITFTVSRKEDVQELINQKIINTVYKAPISAELINDKGNAVVLTPSITEYEFDFASIETFFVSFTLDSVVYEETLKNAQGINVLFVFDDSLTSGYEFMTTYMF